MNKGEQAQYLANLLAIMESKESAGRARGSTLVGEYERNYDELLKEIDNEARKSEQQRK
jgi:hypothetical protein